MLQVTRLLAHTHQYARYTGTNQRMNGLYLLLHIFAGLANDDMIARLVSRLLYTIQDRREEVVIQFRNDHTDSRILAGAQVRSHEIGLVVELLGTCLHQLFGANTNIGVILQRAAHRRDGDIELTRYVLDCYGFHMRIVYATLFPIPDRTAKHNQHGTCHQHIVRVLPFHHAQHGTRQEHHQTGYQ